MDAPSAIYTIRNVNVTEMQPPTMNSRIAISAARKEGSGGVSGRMGLREVALWVVIGAIAGLVLSYTRPTELSNDSYQYLAVAENIANGRGIDTPLVHFDSERSEGRIPAPMTTFAPGYPIIVALSSLATRNFEHGARLISILSFASFAVLMRALAGFAGLRRGWTRFAIALLYTNAFCLHMSTAVLSEPVFLLVSLTGLLLIAESVNGLPGKWDLSRRLIIGQLLVGVSYSIRYAGIFVFASVLVHGLSMLVLLRNRRSLLYLLSSAISGTLIACMMMRNVLLIGTWKGGDEKPVANPIFTVLSEYIRAQVHLLFGAHAVDGWAILAAGLSGAAILWGAITALRRRTSRTAPLTPGASLLLIYGLVATAGLIYLGNASDIDLGPRMFFPLLPLYIVGALKVAEFGCGTANIAGKNAHYWQVMALLFIALYGWVNLREFSAQRASTLLEDLHTSFAKPMANGRPLQEWIDVNIGKNETIAADAGQATGYLLRRPTLSLVESQYSSTRWDQETLTRQMRVFRARFLILNLNLGVKQDPVRSESEFLAQAICCRVHPGFHIAAENPDMRILEVNDR
jgi:hypothetical protein